MHELGILNAMIHTIEDTLASEEGVAGVEEIVVEVGELSGIVPRYLEECWPAARYKTSMAETNLILEIIPGLVECRGCGTIYNAVAEDFHCPVCGEKDSKMISGNDLLIKEIRVIDTE